MGFFVMIDGVDGSGKGTALDALRDWAIERGKSVLDLRSYWKEHNTYPEKIDNYDVIISAEPTYVSHGKHIREELINKDKQYSGEEIADAFAKDRKELYEKIIIPALEQGKVVFQERGIVTSLVYQPLQGVALENVKALEGNALALSHAPDLLIVLKVSITTTMDRLAKREKQDDAIFEKKAFQERVAEIYQGKELKQLFEECGSEVVYIDTDTPSTPEDTKRKIRELVEAHIAK